MKTAGSSTKNLHVKTESTWSKIDGYIVSIKEKEYNVKTGLSF